MSFVPCPHCGSKEVYKSDDEISAGGNYAPDFLPGLGRWYASATFTLVVCRNCGLTRFFASEEARTKLPKSGKWEPA